MSEPGTWSAPFEPWGLLIGEPTCSMTVNGPPQPVIAAIAEEARRKKFRVKVAPDGRSLTAKSSIGVALNLAQVLSPAQFFSSPTLTVVVAEEGPRGTRFTLTVRGDLSEWIRVSVPDVLNRAAWVLGHSGMTVVADPWERYAHLKRTRALQEQARVERQREREQRLEG